MWFTYTGYSGTSPLNCGGSALYIAIQPFHLEVYYKGRTLYCGLLKQGTLELPPLTAVVLLYIYYTTISS